MIAGAIGLFYINFAWAGIPIQHWTQPQGARVYLVESPAIPMVDVQIDLDAGSRRDPADQPGLANLMATSTSNGVRASHAGPALDENQLSEAWADLGASFGGSASADRMSFALRSLTYPDILDQAVALAARQIGEPAFPEAPWLRDRPKLIASLKEANTRPATLAARALNRAVYGNHPYGYEPTEASLLRTHVQHMRDLHARVLRACAVQVSIVGALNRTQADALVTKLLARLPQAGCVKPPPVPEVQPLAAASDQRIAFASAQAHVLVGQPGFKRNDPDFFALTVGNHILGGGGFTARLTEEVREKRGLTYSVYSFFAPGLHAGAFTVGLQTRPDQAEQALALVREVLSRFVAQGPSDKELQAAKDNLMGGFALRIDSNKKLLDNVANIAWNRLPLDYLDTWTQQIDKLTAADVRAAMARVLQPDRMSTVVLGAPDPVR
ncbi:pitrilysin family protein [Rhodoferax sp. TBRC 17660]|uniref:Pitrilysin family protein n=2 Tax=Rhodoferax potami TaxID=3068338 RepID=A0ABU3KK75_9BURK|nr:pitrilysin family protein [Rhodoferax sp. TBRC 17660]MDT7518185.1 pitrilysin family protein [Rhodoferax sp. TBRC 17660]